MRARAALLGTTALTLFAGLASSVPDAHALCTAVTVTDVTCSGTVLNQGPGPNTGFGSATSGPFTVTVEAGASVTGTNIGINLAAGSTVINSGTISGGGTDAIQFHGTGNTLKLTPTSVINGIARGAGSDTLQLGGSGSGVLDVSLINSNSQYRGFTTYQKVDDSIWTLTSTTSRVTSWQLIGGTLSVSSNGNLGAGSGTLTFNGGTLQVTGTGFTSTSRTIIWGANGGGIDIADANNTFSLNQVLTGIGPLVKTGAGTLVLSGASSYSGGTAISGGTLQLGVNSVFNTPGDPNSGIVSSAVGTGVVIINGATLQSGINNITLANQIVLTAAGGTIDNNGNRLTLAGPILDAPGTPGQLVLTGNPSGLTIVSGSNGYAGGTLISGTTVQVRDNFGLGSGAVTLHDAQFQVGGPGGPFTVANNFSVDNTVLGSAIDNNGKSLTLTGNISGDGALTFLNSNPGSGRTILLGTNVYAGGTTICSCSILQLGNNTTAGSIIGVVVNEGSLDVINSDTSAITKITNTFYPAATTFWNSTTASSIEIVNENGGATIFQNSSSAANATITNQLGGTTTFRSSASAGNATITNETTGVTYFENTSTAGNATITNDGGFTIFSNNSTAGNATINNNSFGTLAPGLIFMDNSKAGTATINNGSNGFIAFGFPFSTDTASADHATITNDGLIQFNSFTTAGSAKITTNNAGGVFFWDNATGGSAQFITNAGGTTDFSQTVGPGSDGRISAGSIAGAGDYYLGGNHLTVGSNNLSTEVSGTINDGVSPLLQSLAGCGCGLTFSTGASLEKVGTGTLTLSGINTYSGGTTFVGGVVSVSQDANLGDLAGALGFNGGTLQITGTGFNATTRAINWMAGGGSFDIADAANTFTVSQILTGAGGLTKLGPGTLVLSGANGYAGGTTIAGGTLSVSADNNVGTGSVAMLNGTTLQFTNTFTFLHNITVAGDPTFDVTAGNTTTIAGAITDGATPGDVVKTGTGTLILSGNNTYSGGTVISAGVLQANNAMALGSGAVTLDSGTFRAGAAMEMVNPFRINATGGTIDTNGNTLWLSQPITDASGPGALTKIGAGVLLLTADNTYSGGTTISAGQLQIGNGGTTGSITGNVLNNAVLAFNRSDTVTFGGVISGSGALIKNGIGTLILTGANTYGGGTTIAAGTLSVGAANNLGTGTVAMLNGTTLQFTNSFTLANAITLAGDATLDVAAGRAVTASGAIADGAQTGNLVKAGAGTLILSGANSSSGSTTIAAGTLSIGAANNIGGGPVTMLNGTTLQFTNTFALLRNVTLDGRATLDVTSGNAATVGGAIVDGAQTSSLVKTGAGTLILSGNNTYSGGTTISAGVLQATNGLAVGSGAVTLNGGTFQAGAATEYTNPFRINQIGGAIDTNGNLAWLSRPITDGDGPGALTKIGSGVLLLTADNTYSGGTTINGGRLEIGNGGTTGSIIGNVVNNAVLSFNRADAVTFGGVVSGTGTLAQNGTGTLILTGNSTYTGPTSVNFGTLIVNGSIAASSLLSVKSGTTVGGTGTLPTTSVAGTLSPGNSIGTITVNGNLTFVGAGNYLVEVSPAAADRTNVTGAATLAGTVQVTAQNGLYLPKRYVILNANSVSGTFDTLSVSGSFSAAVRNPHLEYDASNVYFVLDPNAISPFLVNGTVNQRAVATAIDGAFQSGNAPAQFLSLFNLPAAALPAALTQLSGEIGTSAPTAAFQTTDQFLQLMLDPFLETRIGNGTVQGRGLAFAPQSPVQAAMPPELLGYSSIVTKAPPMVAPDPRITVWGAGYGASGRFNGDAVIGSNNLSITNASFAAGIDYRFSRDTTVGLAVSGGSYSYGLDGLGSGRGNVVQGGLYGATRFAGNAYLSAALSYGRHDLTTDRNVTFAGAFDRLTADLNANSWGGRIESGYRFAMTSAFGITPFAAAQVQRFDTSAYAERDLSGLGPAASFALNYGARTAEQTRSELGARIDYRTMLDNAQLTLRARAAWGHEFSTDRSIVASFQALPGFGFTVIGAAQAPDVALVSAGAELKLRNGLAFRAKFDGEFSGRTSIYGGSGGLYLTW